jgi:hypothetical protein
MAITRTPWIDDDGSGTSGTIINNAEKSLLYDQIDAYVGGDWVEIPPIAGNFTADGGVIWAPAQAVYWFVSLGRNTAVVSLYLNPGTLSGSTASLYVAGPVLNLHASQAGPFYYFAGGTTGCGMWGVSSGNRIQFVRDIPATPWTSAPFIVANLTLRIN